MFLANGQLYDQGTAICAVPGYWAEVLHDKWLLVQADAAVYALTLSMPLCADVYPPRTLLIDSCFRYARACGTAQVVVQFQDQWGVLDLPTAQFVYLSAYNLPGFRAVRPIPTGGYCVLYKQGFDVFASNPTTGAVVQRTHHYRRAAGDWPEFRNARMFNSMLFAYFEQRDLPTKVIQLTDLARPKLYTAGVLPDITWSDRHHRIWSMCRLPTQVVRWTIAQDGSFSSTPCPHSGIDSRDVDEHIRAFIDTSTALSDLLGVLLGISLYLFQPDAETPFRFFTYLERPAEIVDVFREENVLYIVYPNAVVTKWL